MRTCLILVTKELKVSIPRLAANVQVCEESTVSLDGGELLLTFALASWSGSAGVASRQHLRSAAQRLLVVPRHQLSSYGRRAFCVAGPSVWNSLPDNLRNPIIGGNSFRQSLKTFLFATY